MRCNYPDKCVFYQESTNEGKPHWKCDYRDDIKPNAYIKECQNFATQKELKWKI